MKIYKNLILLVILTVTIFFFSGCIELLELGEVGEIGVGEAGEIGTGIEADGLGTIKIVDPELVADDIANVKMLEDGELSIMKDGKVSKFAELGDNDQIILNNGKVIKLPGPVYTIDEDVYVRSSPFNTNDNILSSEHYSNGRLVIVNDQINGWYEIMLPKREFGFIPITSASIAHPKRRYIYKKEITKHTGYRSGVNYIINNSFTNGANTKDMIVNITYGDGSFDEVSSLKINNIASEKGYRSTPSFFSKYYYIDDLGEQLRLGNLEYIKKLKLYAHADYLLIGSYSVKIRINQLEAGMLTSDFDYVLNLINLKSGVIEKTFANTIHGNGWTDSQARNDALQAFYQIINQANF